MVANHDRLTGWKDIAAFLDKGVRTVQRWERDFGLPVHRQGAGGDLIFAYRSELETWVRAGGDRLRAQQSPHLLILQERAIKVPEGQTVIGRADDADVQILLPSVSRHHARISVSGRTVTIEDLNSRHGTWRGATRVDDLVPLTSGDEIRLGTALLVYRFVKADDTTL